MVPVSSRPYCFVDIEEQPDNTNQHISAIANTFTETKFLDIFSPYLAVYHAQSKDDKHFSPGNSSGRDLEWQGNRFCRFALTDKFFQYIMGATGVLYEKV
jgi:hypothetical protein